jgi:hypothetical protein
VEAALLDRAQASLGQHLQARASGSISCMCVVLHGSAATEGTRFRTATGEVYEGSRSDACDVERS